MAVSDELGSIMRAHDDEAPTAADLGSRPWAAASGCPRPLSRRRGALLPAAAAGAAVLIVAGVVVLTRAESGASHPVASGRSTSAGPTGPTLPPVQCPSAFDARASTGSSDIWSPAAPSGVDTAGHLVPNQTPSSAVVCSYVPAKTDQLSNPAQLFPVTGRRVIDGDLDAVRDELVWVPPARQDGVVCDTYSTQTDFDNYLVGLRYPGRGTVWVSAPGDHCAGSTNGRFIGDANLRADAAASYAAGRWAPEPAARVPGDPCSGGTGQFGRFGEQNSLVPARPTSSTICTIGLTRVRGAGSRYRTTGSSVVSSSNLAELVRRLDALPTTPASSGCANEPLGTRRYEIRFDYSDGPSLSLTVDQGNTCFGDIRNGSLRSLSSAAVLPLLDRLTR